MSVLVGGGITASLMSIICFDKSHVPLCGKVVAMFAALAACAVANKKMIIGAMNASSDFIGSHSTK